MLTRKMTGSIQGKVGTEVIPLPNGRISFCDQNGKEPNNANALTQADGSFNLIADIPYYYCRASAPGYLAQVKPAQSNQIFILQQSVFSPAPQVIAPPAAASTSTGFNKTYLWIGIGIAAIIILYFIFKKH
jgi:hypothetical protein